MRHLTQSGTVHRLAAVGVAAALLAGCATGGGQSSTGPYPLPPPDGGEVVVAGAAIAADGTRGRYPPNSTMIVRVYDGRGDVNRPVAQRLFRDGTGQLPWRYRLTLSAEAFASMGLPAVAARVEAPDGQVIYRNVDASILGERGPDNISMVRQIPPGPRR